MIVADKKYEDKLDYIAREIGIPLLLVDDPASLDIVEDVYHLA